MATATRAAVGRDASTRRTPRRRKVPRADMESAPTTGGGCAVGRENANLTLPHPCAPPPLASCTILVRLTRGGVVEGAETALTASIVHIYAKFGVLSIPKQADLLYNLDKSS